MTNCPNCGAPKDGSGTCAYCGTRYSQGKTLQVDLAFDLDRGLMTPNEVRKMASELYSASSRYFPVP